MCNTLIYKGGCSKRGGNRIELLVHVNDYVDIAFHKSISIRGPYFQFEDWNRGGQDWLYRNIFLNAIQTFSNFFKNFLDRSSGFVGASDQRQVNIRKRR